MAAWLHWIGKVYYTRKRFVQEAQRYGVTRRISFRDLRRMRWGDRVYLIQLSGKSGVVFGWFDVETTSGLSEEASAKIRATVSVEEVKCSGATLVERGCGSYVVVATYAVTASISEIAEILEDCQDVGRLMVGGRLHLLDEMWGMPSLVRLKDVPFRQGFRLFDEPSFIEQAMALAAGSRIVTLKGQFYADPDSREGLQPGRRPGPVGNLVEVRDYTRASVS